MGPCLVYGMPWYKYFPLQTFYQTEMRVLFQGPYLRDPMILGPHQGPKTPGSN